TARCISEVSFLSDAAEERRLASPAYRERIARALARAVDRSLVRRARALDVDWCVIRQSIVNTALAEEAVWTRPNNTRAEESARDMLDRLRAYWRDGVKVADWDAQAKASAADSVAWSAAFVSWVVRTAGVTDGQGFKFSSRHIDYIVEALRNRERSSR